MGGLFCFNFLNDKVNSEQSAPIGYNVKTLGEGGDFHHKCRCVERMLNIAVNVERGTAPPLLPNVCYALFFCVGNQ